MVHPYCRPDYTLSSGAADGMLVKMNCRQCRSVHRYHPADLVALCGDIPIYEVASWFRCEKCATRDHLKAGWDTVMGPDIGKTRVRRLVRVRMVRVPEWREEIV
jgi:hypothetical protein